MNEKDAATGRGRLLYGDETGKGTQFTLDDLVERTGWSPGQAQDYMERWQRSHGNSVVWKRGDGLVTSTAALRRYGQWLQWPQEKPDRPYPEVCVDGTRVYFLMCDEKLLVKIGWSQNVPHRIAAIRSTSPLPLRLALTEEGGYEHEKQRHEDFDSYREHFEWFRVEGALMDYLASSGVL